MLAFVWGSFLATQLYGKSNYRQTSYNGRYEPRRPSESFSPVAREAVAQARPGRYAPTRPHEVRANRAGTRFAPRRPDEQLNAAPEQRQSRSSRILETVSHVYGKRELSGFDAEQLSALQEQFLSEELEKRAKGGIVGKAVKIPVKIVYKVVTKVIGKVAFDWWIPLL